MRGALASGLGIEEKTLAIHKVLRTVLCVSINRRLHE